MGSLRKPGANRSRRLLASARVADKPFPIPYGLTHPPQTRPRRKIGGYWSNASPARKSGAFFRTRRRCEGASGRCPQGNAPALAPQSQGDVRRMGSGGRSQTRGGGD